MSALPPFSPTNGLFGVTNWNPLVNLSKTRAALNRVRAGQGNMAINLYGHSGIVGVGGGTLSGGQGQYIVGAEAFNVGAALMKALNSYGVPTRRGGWFGCQNLGLQYMQQYDSRLVAGTGWTDAAAGNNGSSFGAKMAFQNTSTTGALTFTPVESWDRLTTYFAKYSGGGTFTVDTGGAALTTQSTSNASQAFGSVVTSAASDAVQAANVKAPTLGGGVYIIGQESYRSTKNEARVRTIGWNGGLSSDMANASVPYNSKSALGSLGGDLTIIECMLNDFHTSVSVSTFQANLQAIASAAQGNGDVILLVDWMPASWTITGISSYISGIYAVASSLNLPVVDFTKRFGADGTAATANGYFSSDNVHYNPTGLSDMGTWLGQLLACQL